MKRAWLFIRWILRMTPQCDSLTAYGRGRIYVCCTRCAGHPGPHRSDASRFTWW